jgi:hypothetical protein
MDRTQGRGARDSRGGAARLAIAVVFLGACAAVLFLALTGRLPNLAKESSSAVGPTTGTSAGLQVRSTLDDYSWAEIAQIASQIEAAPDDAAALSIAAAYHLANSDGSLPGDAKSMTLSDGTQSGAQIVGIRHDDKSDGTGKAGLTFVTTSAIASRPMNSGGGVEGGWEASEMRAWLATDGMALLPSDLAGTVVAVDKASNNVGSARDTSAISLTSDRLWLLSAHETAGDIDWFKTEYGSDFAYLDDVTNAEGSQYRLFSQKKVSSTSDPTGTLARAFAGKRTAWWYRTAFQFVYQGLESRWFYTVLDSGFPHGYAAPESSAGVVVGFCV